MKISWVFSENIPHDIDEYKDIKETAPIWGSWKAWKDYKIDNCVCSNFDETKKLLARAFHAVCNFYILQDHYIKVGSPIGVKVFTGQFRNDHMINKDDIVALNLAVANNDIILMLGFDFSPITENDDEITRLNKGEYYFNVMELIKSNLTKQFVLVDYTHEMASWVKDLENLNFDNIKNVKSLLT